MGRTNIYWINDLFDRLIIPCPDGTSWRIDSKISEKSFIIMDHKNNPTGESQAVYNSHQVEGPSIGKEAIIKVRLQSPSKCSKDSPPEERAKEALPRGYYAWPTVQELETLTTLNKAGCPVVPRLLHELSYYQTDNCPVPGGYIKILVLEKCPGHTLLDFCRFGKAKKEKVRNAFRRDLQTFLSFHADVSDPSPKNVIYDEKQDKCWFIDHEDTEIDEQMRPREVTDRLLYSWGL